MGIFEIGLCLVASFLGILFILFLVNHFKGNAKKDKQPLTTTKKPPSIIEELKPEEQGNATKDKQPLTTTKKPPSIIEELKPEEQGNATNEEQPLTTTMNSSSIKKTIKSEEKENEEKKILEEKNKNFLLRSGISNARSTVTEQEINCFFESCKKAIKEKKEMIMTENNFDVAGNNINQVNENFKKYIEYLTKKDKKDKNEKEIKDFSNKFDEIFLKIIDFENKVNDHFIKNTSIGLDEKIKNIEKLEEDFKDFVSYLGDILPEDNEFLKEIKKTIKFYEKKIITNLFDRFEFEDDKESVSKNEFNDFLRALPKSYRDRFSKMNKSFEELVRSDNELAQGDKEMDYDIFTKMIDSFAEQEAMAGGSV